MSEEEVRELIEKYKITKIVIDDNIICIKNDYCETIKDIKNKAKK